jgi:hypothetical protein
MTGGTFAMRRQVLEEHPGGRVVMVDTIAHIRLEDAGQVVVCGSHGGLSSGEYAGTVAAAAVFFNDAGGGKDEAGRAALPLLDARGIAAGTVSHDTAMIGDALDTWTSGIVSALNDRAGAAGFVIGAALRDTVRHVLKAEADAQ